MENKNSFKFLAIIPARKSSKRIKDKNKKKIRGLSLIDIAIKNSIKSKMIGMTVLSTDYKNSYKSKFSKNFIYISRPKSLCTDNVTTEKVISHTIKFLKKKNINFENVVLLQPTSPFRTQKHIDEAAKLFIKHSYDSLFSAYLDKLFIWKKKNSLSSITYNYMNRKKTQDMKPNIIENGAIFIFKAFKFLKHKNRLFEKIGIYKMSKSSSFEIDDLEDLKIAKKISLDRSSF